MSPLPRATAVALLAPCSWPEVRGDAERLVRELAGGLVAHGHRPRLICGHRSRWITRSVEQGLEVIRVPRPAEGRLRRRGYEDYLTHAPYTAGALRLSDHALSHALYPTDAVVGARWGRRTGRPTVFSYVGIPTRPWLVQRRLRAHLTQRAALESDAVVASSHAAAREFQRTLGIRARVIHPGVDVQAFRPGPARDRRPEPTIFSATARDAPNECTSQLVEAFRLVRREVPDSRLVLSRPGDPGRARRVEAADENIVLVDVGDRADLAREYRGAWVSALPSVNEPAGLALLESMACGTPVVARRSGGHPEIVDRDGVGLLYDGGPQELADALLRGLDLAGGQATGPACRARAEELTTRSCVDRYEALYAELLAAS